MTTVQLCISLRNFLPRFYLHTTGLSDGRTKTIPGIVPYGSAIPIDGLILDRVEHRKTRFITRIRPSTVWKIYHTMYGHGCQPLYAHTEVVTLLQLLMWFDLQHYYNELTNIYPDDPRFGSPYGTGNQTFGLDPEYKHYASILGDLLLNAERRLFARKMNEASVPISRIVGSDMMPASAQELSTIMMDYWIAFANGMNPNDEKGSKRPEWGLYKTGRPEMMELKGGDTKMIEDTAREHGMAFINQHAVLFNR
ncbi:hypothetical protein MPER_08964 [Moniliophthora perniciosa FA553]|nr:hypothetical protein MPER_08964 [Moniliophthora perniciosa FA553]